MKTLFTALMALPLVASDEGEVEKTLAEKIDYEEIEVTGGGKISGLVLWEGDAPEPARFPINKDQEVCCKHADGAERLSPRLCIDGATHGVENAVIFLADIERGRPLATLQTPVLEQVNCEFNPHVLFVHKGSKIQMRSSDEVLHNIHAVGPSRFNKPFPLRDMILEQRMRKPGVTALRCDAGHYWMSGYVFVVQHPYFAVSDEQGAFQLDDVPAGNYELFVWHEGWNVVKADEDREGNITRNTFDAPKESGHSIEVQAGGEVKVKFSLSDAGFEVSEGEDEASEEVSEEVPEEAEAEKALEEEGGYEEIEVTGGGELHGQVLWEGEIPELVALSIDGDPKACEQHAAGEERTLPRLRVDETSHGVANAVVFLADIERGKPLATLPSSVLDQTECEFEPHILFVQKGEKIQTTPADGDLQDVRAVEASRSNEPFPLAGMTTEQVTKGPGILELSRGAGHPWTSAFLFVVQHPYFAVSDEQGVFQLDDVPAGTYELCVWHEGWNVTETDADQEGNITRNTFDAPRESRHSIEVPAGGAVKVKFLLSDAGFEVGE